MAGDRLLVRQIRENQPFLSATTRRATLARLEALHLLAWEPEGGRRAKMTGLLNLGTLTTGLSGRTLSGGARIALWTQ